MQVQTYLKISVAVALVTIGLKTAAWWLTESVSLLSDALESLVNLAGAIFALMMVTVAARPPDDDHPFGHHKAEYFSSGFEGVLIVAAALGILAAAVERLVHPHVLQGLGLGAVLSLLSAALNGALAWSMLRKARSAHSMALEGDARHLWTDVYTSVGVVLGLLAVQWTGWVWLDPAVAIVVSLNILYEGGRLIQASAQGLMDSALEDEWRQQIDTVVAAHTHQSELRVDHLATRRAGARRFVDLHLHVPGDWPLRAAAERRDALERALMAAVPGLRASIQLLPLGVEAADVDGRCAEAAP